MRRWQLSLLLLVSLGAIALLVLETRRLAELAGTHEVAARRAHGEATATAQALARATADLQAANARLQAMTDLVEAKAEAHRRAAAAAAAAAQRSLAPLPDGVRLCLQALHDCLRDEGFTAQRFLSARALDAAGLHEVELLDLHGDGLGVTFVRAGRMTAALDRATGRLELRFFDGERSVGGERLELPADGWQLVFTLLDGRAVEQRLPYLVQATGAYPAAAAGAAAGDVDPLLRRRWLERFDRLLAAAGGGEQLQVTRFRGMQDGWFLDAEVVATDARHHVVSMASCRRLAVEVDAAAGVVSLLLRDGNLRRAGVDSTISAEGYRMLLPNLSVREASDTMFGMVVSK
jgi:hypothetical protein